MRVGVITYWTTEDNYGQILQCYALQTYLRSINCDAFLIRYKPQKSVIGRILDVFMFCASAIIHLLDKKRRIRHKKIDNMKQMNNNRLFDKFIQQNIQCTDIVYRSLKDLKNNPPEADCYIVGSDQVWRNDLDMPETGVWYLDFGSPNVIRASYAASIGREIRDSELAKFKHYLSFFDYVSVRETSAWMFCKKIGIGKVENTIDPTLLMGREIYSKYLRKPEGEPYLFIYQINIYKPEEIYWNEIQVFLNEYNLKVKVVSSSGHFMFNDIIPNCPIAYDTIQDWLNSIYNAKFVVTTSFHGVVFCILFHTPFVAIALNNEFKDSNNRVVDLLSNLKLENRIVYHKGEIEKVLNLDINWAKVDDLVQKLRDPSISFINNIITNGKQ